MPGSLGKFLSKVNGQWNFSLFNYQNYGVDVSRVLLGMQVEPSSIDEFNTFLESLKQYNYNFKIESDNEVFKLFSQPQSFSQTKKITKK